MATWPNFFIAGASKCGTSSLHAYLQTIPGIYMSRIKEPNYFSRIAIADDNPMVKPVRDEQQYLRLFEEAGDAKVIGEASPSYLEDPEAPFLIERAAPGAKVLVSLRDPVERLYSHYLMMLNSRPSMSSFQQEIERGLELQHNSSLAVLAPDRGLYYEQVLRFRSVFGADRFKVILFEEFTADVPATLRQVLDFLDIDYPVADFKATVYREFAVARGPIVRYLWGNRTISQAAEVLIPPGLRKFIRETFLVKKVPKPKMDAASREFLQRYYAEDVLRLQELLGRPLPWRNFAADTTQRPAA
jgi:Sulfotransferase family